MGGWISNVCSRGRGGCRIGAKHVEDDGDDDDRESTCYDFVALLR